MLIWRSHFKEKLFLIYVRKSKKPYSRKIMFYSQRKQFNHVAIVYLSFRPSILSSLDPEFQFFPSKELFHLLFHPVLVLSSSDFIGSSIKVIRLRGPSPPWQEQHG